MSIFYSYQTGKSVNELIVLVGFVKNLKEIIRNGKKL